MEVRPNSRNVVPGEVFFCVDLRHPEAAVLDQLEAEYQASLREICDPLGLSVDPRPGSGTSRRYASTPDCVASVRRAAAALRLFGARDRLRRRPRCRLCVARRADRDDLRALPRRRQPQRGGVHLEGAVRGRRAGAAAGRARLRPQPAPNGQRSARCFVIDNAVTHLFMERPVRACHGVCACLTMRESECARHGSTARRSPP